MVEFSVSAYHAEGPGLNPQNLHENKKKKQLIWKVKFQEVKNTLTKIFNNHG